MFVFVTGTYVLVYYTIIIHCWPTTLTLIFCTDMCIKTWILQPLTMNCRSQVLLKSNLCILMNSIVTSHQLFLSFLFNIRHDTLDSDKFITALTKHTLHLLVAHKIVLNLSFIVAFDIVTLYTKISCVNMYMTIVLHAS